MMNEDFITYEQAVQLKELGFDWDCSNNSMKYLGVETPTLSQAQKWLREIKGINILVNIATNKETYITKKVFYFKWFNSEFIFCGVSKYHYATYEEALLEGINKTLELLKIENK